MLLLGKTQKKHLGDLPPTVPDLPPPTTGRRLSSPKWLAKYTKTVYRWMWPISIQTGSK